MIRAMRERRIPQRSGAWAALVAIAACACVGCTICPDPFDYSGPVPDGSPPQNDFRARSGGIHPLDAAPKPWPRVVHDDGLPAASPVMADPEPQLVDEDETSALRQTSVLVPDGAVRDVEEAAETQLSVSFEETSPQLEPVPADDVPDVQDAPTGESKPSTDAPPSVPPAGEPAETPGWRPRRR